MRKIKLEKTGQVSCFELGFSLGLWTPNSKLEAPNYCT